MNRARHRETTISVIILIVLLLIAAGISKQQKNANISRFGITDTAQENQTAEEKPKTTENVESFSPAGFSVLSKPEIYDADDLYEKINGKAPLYTESGFVKLTTIRFASQADTQLWMEVYIFDMGNIRNAFSVHSVQRRAEIQPLAERHTYQTTNAMFMVHGKYYIEIIGSAESAELLDGMIGVSEKIRQNLAIESNAVIDELSLLPVENALPASSKLYLNSAFGFDGLTDTFTRRYKIDGEIITAFLLKRTSSEQATQTAEKYCSFLLENGAVEKAITIKNFEGKVLGFYGTTEIVFAEGEFVAGVHEAENQGPAEKLAVMLKENLKNQK